MANKRTIVSDLFEDDDISRLDFFGRLLWIGLITAAADDQGRLLDSPALIRAKIFPYDAVTDEQVEGVLDSLARMGGDDHRVITRYEVRGRRIIQLVNWWRYQAGQWAGPSKLPAPAQWMDRMRYHGKGNVIVTKNWDKSGGYIGGYIADYIAPITERDVNGEVNGEGDGEGDADADADTRGSSGSEANLVPPNLKATEEEVDFLKQVCGNFDTKPANTAQARRILDYRLQYGPQKTLEALLFYATQGVSLDESVKRAGGALPTWGQRQVTANGNGNGSRPPPVSEPKSMAALRALKEEYGGKRTGV